MALPIPEHITAEFALKLYQEKEDRIRHVYNELYAHMKSNKGLFS